MTSPEFDDWPDALEPLYVPVPMNLAQLLGYKGRSRFVAFYWNQTVDELAYHDGDDRGVGESQRFLTYAGHPNVEGELTTDIGLIDWPASHWLLLDTEKDTLYTGSPIEIRGLLVLQHQADPADIVQERFDVVEDVYETLNDDPQLDALEEYLDRWSSTEDAA